LIKDYSITMNARSLIIVNQAEHIAPQQFHAALANAQFCSRMRLTVSVSTLSLAGKRRS
jgi:hypothetical protein